MKGELLEAAGVLDQFLSDASNLQKINLAAQTIAESLHHDGKVISCGNGGSHCDAMHFAEELTGRYRENRKALSAIAISDPSHISCTANDYGYEHVFSRFIEGLGRENDVLFAISTSGNSQNIILAVEAARQKGMKVILLTGKDGGKMKNLSDVEIIVPHFGFADRIQEVHIKIIHIIILLIEKMMIRYAG
ncbi:MAG: D-sedoheptulose 7-phosphate isomerase [Bacteroidota bacterium]|nr:D-sedoheptulose 7-phosphate isomerase [Bacteroidota bacterium]